MDAICGPTRGHYGYPWSIVGPLGIIQWVSETYKPIPPPRVVSCGYPQHHKRRLNYPLGDCFVQHWEMTDQEFEDATEAYDMMSLDMPNRIVCPHCRDAAIGKPGYRRCPPWRAASTGQSWPGGIEG